MRRRILLSQFILYHISSQYYPISGRTHQLSAIYQVPNIQYIVYMLLQNFIICKISIAAFEIFVVPVHFFCFLLLISISFIDIFAFYQSESLLSSFEIRCFLYKIPSCSASMIFYDILIMFCILFLHMYHFLFVFRFVNFIYGNSRYVFICFLNIIYIMCSEFRCAC